MPMPETKPEPAHTPGKLIYDDEEKMLFAADPYGHGEMIVAEMRGWGHLIGVGSDAEKIMDSNGRRLAACWNAPTGLDPAAIPGLLAERKELLEALKRFERAAYPVAESINSRGHNWSEAYLDSALVAARAAIQKAER